MFTPWIKPLQSSGGASFPGGSLPPCLDSEVGLLKTIMTLFVNSVSKAHSRLQGKLKSVISKNSFGDIYVIFERY